MPGIVVDIGTGDGDFVYQMAKQHPDRLFIGLDPNHKAMIKPSAKALAKSAKGGLENVLFALASIEDLPVELNGQANQVFINFPWAGLLSGIVTADPVVWSNIHRICQPGAFVDILFGYQDSYESAEIQHRNLPKLDDAYLYQQLAPKLSKIGFNLVEQKPISGHDLKHYPTSWAKRLGHGRQRTFQYLRVQVK